MKALLILASLALSSQAFSETVNCRSDKTIQAGLSTFLKTDAQLTFELNRSTKTITKIKGHIFVSSGENDDALSTDNAYMGFFQLESLTANPSYRPNVYKGFSQFKDFDASHTTGLEDGMYGNLVIDLTKKSAFEARYIFQAGDHMGGTVLLDCKIR